jgi:hypothetical protein
VYYGAAPDAPSPSSPGGNLWVVSRPHNWRAPAAGAREAALLLDGLSGALLRDVPLPSQFTHDLVRHGDKVRSHSRGARARARSPCPHLCPRLTLRPRAQLYVADTGHGSVWELQLPGLETVRELKLFTATEHVNSLAVWPGQSPEHPPQLWAVLHNLGPSQLVRIDLERGVVAQRFKRVGDKSHCLSLWRGRALMLSSGEGSLISVDLEAAAAEGDAYVPAVLWTDPGKTFMKGLTVIADVAYVGISAFGSRKDRDDVNKTSDVRPAAPAAVAAADAAGTLTSRTLQVAAIDLNTNLLLWRVTVQTRGLLNIVSAPHLSHASTSMALSSWTPDADLSQPAVVLTDGGDPAGRDDAALSMATKQFKFTSFESRGEARPRSIKLEHKRLVARTNPAAFPAELLGEAAFVSLAHVDVEELTQLVHAEARRGLWDSERAKRENAVLGGRDGNMARFKPGVQSAHLVFSSQDASVCYHFPYWEETWRPVVLPILQTVMGWYGVPPAEAENRIVRLQFARMGGGGAILKHADKGGWATGLHRVHIPLITNPDVQFLMQSDREGTYIAIPVAPGDVFEINNAVPHEVHNSRTEERVHLLVDFAEAPIVCGHLKKGQKCGASPSKERRGAMRR